MDNSEALALDQYDIVFYNGREWLVLGLLGRDGHVRLLRLADRNGSAEVPPHRVTFWRKGNGRLDYGQLDEH